MAMFDTTNQNLGRHRKTRNVSLTPQLEAFVAGKVASGRYRSASEVVRAALRLLENEEPPGWKDERVSSAEAVDGA
jgi:antitoxin ParD1/3/4